jgi:biotin synthase-like enzyme
MNFEDKKNKNELFYFDENGNVVFTKAYHLKRGYCCKNGCKHCPYNFKKETNNKKQ